MAGDHAVARDELVAHSEVAASVGDELVQLLEGARVEQPINPLAGGELAGVALPLLANGTAAELGELLEVCEAILGIHAWAAARPSRADG